MPKGYHRLTYVERCWIEVLKKSGVSQDALARQMGRDRSTLSREIKRTAGERRCRDKFARESGNTPPYRIDGSMAPDTGQFKLFSTQERTLSSRPERRGLQRQNVKMSNINCFRASTIYQEKLFHYLPEA